jgi:hypothetical protein
VVPKKSCCLPDEEFGQKMVSVMLDGQEAELEIVDHSASEMSVSPVCPLLGVCWKMNVNSETRKLF